jgi:hypothetical protein
MRVERLNCQEPLVRHFYDHGVASKIRCSRADNDRNCLSASSVMVI